MVIMCYRTRQSAREEREINSIYEDESPVVSAGCVNVRAVGKACPGTSDVSVNYANVFQEESFSGHLMSEIIPDLTDESAEQSWLLDLYLTDIISHEKINGVYVDLVDW
jgi:hypothetical protein